MVPQYLQEWSVSTSVYEPMIQEKICKINRDGDKMDYNNTNKESYMN